MERGLRLLGIGAALRTLGAAIYGPFLALFFVDDLGLGYVEVGVLVAAIGVATVPFYYAGGLLADRVGRRPLIVLGVIGEAASIGVLALAFAERSLPGAILAAFSSGALGSMGAPGAAAYIADLSAGPTRTRAYSYYRVGFNVGYSIGVSAGGLMIAAIGFAGSVAVATAILAGGAAFVTLLLPPSPRDQRRGAGVPAGASDPPAPAPPRRVRESLRLVARDRVALELLVAMALAALVAGQWSVTFPLFVHNLLGVSYAFLGIGLAVNGVLVVLGQTATTESVIGRRHTAIAALGIVFYAAAFLGLAAAGQYEIAPLPLFFLAVAVLTVGENLLSIPQNTLPSNLAPSNEIGAYNGIFTVAGNLGGTAAVLLGGFALASSRDPLLIWTLLVTPAVPALLLLRHASGRVPRAQDTA